MSTSITHIYTSQRFYSSDNSNWLSPYQLWNASVTFTLKSIVLGIKCDNVLNTSYQEIANRAMPGILPSINFKFEFHE